MRGRLASERDMKLAPVATAEEIASGEVVSKSYVSRMQRLMLLTPEIVEAILDWRQSGTPTLPGLFRPFPAELWQQSATVWPDGLTLAPPCGTNSQPPKVGDQTSQSLF